GQRLDRHETLFAIASPVAGLRLDLRYLPPTAPQAGAPRVVLYVHGGTFPSALSIAHRFAGQAHRGRSWRDALNEAGFHCWGLDFHGFGALSDRYPEMAEPAQRHPPLGRTESASRQLEAAVRHIAAYHGVPRISLVAHSWGTMVAGEFAGRCPELVERLVLFGPIARREAPTDSPGVEPQRLPAWRLISLADQWTRFTADVPRGEAPVLLERHFAEWGERYLDGDKESRTRSPASVKVPSGAFQDIFDAWGGSLAYDPARVLAPVAIIRGEWDSYTTDEDARWLLQALKNAPLRRDIKIARGTHLMHLEESRVALYRETKTFLRGDDLP
ncbi:MAG: alpha/beta hydrolase, partial [Alphaproteobacteria bacterium]|nr:alpha/beta hydrolase [Alphaproteobacteria bacterium]